jgi:hypothetical protein
MIKKSEKFEFNVDFQWDILNYTLVEPRGYRVLVLYHYSYFDLTSQQIIARAIRKYFDKWGKVPGRASVLLEQLKPFYRNRDYVTNLKESDRVAINNRVKRLYRTGAKDAGEILEKVQIFASYVEVKQVMSKFDINNYSGYEKIASKLHDAVAMQKSADGHRGSFIVEGVRGRIARRMVGDSLTPTPFTQLNRTTNAGGYSNGAIIVLLDKEKGGKTLSLVNVARGYLRLRKKVCIIDFENGLESVEDRVDQSVGNVSKMELRRHDPAMDQKLKRIYRKYARLGAEIYVERLPSGSTFNDIDKVFKRLKEDHGFIADVLIADYFILMSPIKERTRDDLNISQVYIEAKDFAETWGVESIWTANHIKREAYKKRAKRYESGDAAKALDIGRHADAVIGINQSYDDEKMGVLRWEIVDQRDGTKGVILFKVDHVNQRLDEFNNEERQKYIQSKLYSTDEDDNSSSQQPLKDDLHE